MLVGHHEFTGSFLKIKDMTKEKQKAVELVDKFSTVVDNWDCYNDEPLHYEDTLCDRKKGALICVDEMLSITPMYTGNLNTKWKFLNDVKIEIEKL